MLRTKYPFGSVISKSVILVISFFAIAFSAIVIYLPHYSKYLELRREDAQLGEMIERLRGKNERLEEEIRLLETDRNYLEKVARESLGMVKPGEVVYKTVPVKRVLDQDKR